MLSIAIPEERLSEMSDDHLVMRQLAVFKEDKDWRDQHTSFDASKRLYERRTGSGNSEPGIPTRNLIKRAVDDRHALSIINVPKTKLVANIDVDHTKTFVEKYIDSAVAYQTQDVLNGHVENILTDNRFPDVRNSALKHAAIYGVGYVKVDIDQTTDTRFSSALRYLQRKPLWEWTEQDSATYDFLSNRVDVCNVNAPDVFWQHGIRQLDKTMVRVSLVERGDVNTLRRIYDNPEIRTGQFPHEIDEDPDNDGTLTAILTTWEIEPVMVERSLEAEDGEIVMETTTTEWVMIKTVIVGGQLVEKTITGNFEDEESGIQIGSIQLPIIPYYIQKSEDHPYGYSIPQQMSVSEDFINKMYLIMYKSARKAASNQGLIINGSMLGDGDIFKIQQMLDDGGVAVISGNQAQSQNPDLSKVVQPLNPYNAQLPVSIIEAVRNEEAAFGQISGTPNAAAISRAKSGSGKRAEITATDRPKSASLAYLATAEELVYEAVYNLVQIYHNDYVNVPIDVPGQGKQSIPLNLRVTRVVPILNENGDPVFDEVFADRELAGNLFNPNGLAMTEVTFTLNSVATSMKAESDGRHDLPHDLTQRLQILSGIHGIAPLEPETLYELLLPRDVKAINNVYREKRLKLESEQQQLLLNQQQQPQGGSPSFPKLEGADSLGTLLQDVQNDQDQGRAELTQSQEQQGLRPF